MSFNIALSGIAAAQTDLDCTANNIANVNTVGFKESRAEFDSVYANSLFVNSKTKVGDGVSVATVAQQFHQGSLKFTENPLDIAISGNGFFVIANNVGEQDYTYTRAGTFKLDSKNRVVNNDGNFLQGFPINEDGSSASVSLSTTTPITIPETAGNPVKTSEVQLTLNFPAGSDLKDPALFDPKDRTTYNEKTSVAIYDSLGGTQTMTTYYVKPDDQAAGASNEWVTFVTVGGKPVNPQTMGQFTKGGVLTDVESNVTSGTPPVTTNYQGVVLKFDTSGHPVAGTPTEFAYQALGTAIPAGADPTQVINLKFIDPSQYNSKFVVTGLQQDGLTVGRLTGVEIAADGLVKATYSNGTAKPLARVAMVRFRNDQGLKQKNSSWIASQDSGEPLAGEADSGSFGTMKSGALEQANVNLTTELVDLMTAQRNYQANSRALETNVTLLQTILQIR